MRRIVQNINRRGFGQGPAQAGPGCGRERKRSVGCEDELDDVALVSGCGDLPEGGCLLEVSGRSR